MAESFPLDWPVGYKRTKSRRASKFKQSPDKGQEFLYQELKRLGASKVIISTNVPLRRDGRIYSEYMTKKIDDPGVAVYFLYKQKDVVMCCDTYEHTWENVYAIGKGIEGIRVTERHGISEFLERAFTGFKAIPETVQQNSQTWFEVLGIPEHSDKEQIKVAYRKLAQVHHPDAGGGATMFNKITQAYQQGINSKP